MRKRSVIQLQVDPKGCLHLPPGLAERFGLLPGAQVRLEETDTGFTLTRSTANLARIYVEPTNICNLDCRTCMRNVWNEAPGNMSPDTFERILQGVRAIEPHPLVFFGGFGEPLSHPRILEMVAAVKSTGAEVELITNGILLDEKMARRLIELGLNRLWVSLDGATPKSYADVRLGAALPQVLANLNCLRELRLQLGNATPHLGIAFVAMRRNIRDLPEVVRIGKSLGADQFSVSNVLPHTPELRDEILYRHSLYESGILPSQWSPLLSLPRMDINSLTRDVLAEALKGAVAVNITRQEIVLGANTCPFVEKGSVSIRWDGAVSPCLALLHESENYLDDRLRKSHDYAVGNVNELGLVDIWNSPSYVDLRQHLLSFDFSPCTFCNSCEMAENNLEDCFGSLLPACGGCLWAQGFIQCP